MTIDIIRTPITQNILRTYAETFGGEMAKVVVDLERKILAIGGDYHADEEAVLLADESQQANLWGANVFPGRGGDDRIEYDSMVNIRPRIGNRSRLILDQAIRDRVRQVIDELIPT